MSVGFCGRLANRSRVCRCLTPVSLILVFGALSCSEDTTSPSDPGSLGVVVRNSGGEQIPGALVLVHGSGSPGQITDGAGFTLFEDLESGAYRILASEPTHGGGMVAAQVTRGRQSEVLLQLFRSVRLQPFLDLVEPEEDAIIAVNSNLNFVGFTLDREGPSEGIELVLESKTNGTFLSSTPAADGSFSLSVPALVKGHHSFTITATNLDGFWAADTVNVTVTPSAADLAQPTYQAGTVGLSWSRNTDLDFASYEVLRSSELDPGVETTLAMIDDAAVTNFVDVAPPRGTVVIYRIRALDLAGNESFSNLGFVDTAATPIDFPYAFGDAVLHPSEPLLYLAVPDHRAIYSINYDTETMVDSLFFDFPVERLAIHDTGTHVEMYATLLTSNHSWTWDYEDQLGYLAVVDPDAMAVKEVRLLDIDPYDVVLGRDGYLYIPSGSGQHSRIRSIPRRGVEPGTSAALYQGCRAEIHPVYDRIYAVGANDRASFDVESGRFVRTHRLELGSVEEFAISPRGEFFFSDARDVYSCNVDPGLDLQRAGELPSSWSAIGFDEEGDRVFTAFNKEVQVLRAGTWESVRQLEIDIRAEELFYRNETLILVGSAHGPYRTQVQVVRL